MLFQKKFLFISIILSIFVFWFFSFVYSVNPSIKIDRIKLDWSTTNNVLKKRPWDDFGVSIYWNNNWDVDLTWQKLILNFSNSSNFSYNWYFDVQSPWNDFDPIGNISTSLYNSWFDLFLDVDWSWGILPPSSDYYEIFIQWDDSKDFTINSDIADYQSNLNIQICANYWNDQYCAEKNREIYTNVKPYITNYYFVKSWANYTPSNEVTSIKNNGEDSINLVIKVKDYNIDSSNWCSNVVDWIFQANLSWLLWDGYENANLSYVDWSCDTSNHTALFDYKNITTIMSSTTHTVDNLHFTWSDADGNTRDLSESIFTNENETDKIYDFQIKKDTTPEVSFISNQNKYLWPNTENTEIAFSWNQSGEAQISPWEVCSASSGIWSSYNTTWAEYTWTVNYQDLAIWQNPVYLCIKNNNWEIGYYSLNLYRDETSPSVSWLSYSPTNINEEDVNWNYSCEEWWNFQVEIWWDGNLWSGILGDSGSCLADESNSFTVANNKFSTGDNTFYAYCIDKAGNFDYKTGNITKEIPSPPSMSGETVTLKDNDNTKEWLNGYDISVTWGTWVLSWYEYFWQYLIYILPETTSLDIDSHNFVDSVGNMNIGSRTWDKNINTDSAGDSLVNEWNYKAYVLVSNTNGEKGEPWSSTSSKLYEEVITDFNITDISFSSTGNIRIVSSLNFTWNKSLYDLSWIFYTTWWNLYNPNSIDRVDWNNLYLNIDYLNKTNLTGIININTGALVAEDGKQNSLLQSGNITDWIAPIIQSFSTWTVSFYQNFYSGFLNLNWHSSEILSGFDNSYIQLENIWGNTDNQTHKYKLQSFDNGLNSGDAYIDLDLSGQDRLGQNLVDGSEYIIKLIAKDYNLNTSTNQINGSIVYDNAWPDKVSLNTLDTLWTGNFDLTWNIPVDNNWNWAWVKSYTVNFYNWTGCVDLSNTYDVSTNSKTVSLWNGDYSWKVRAIDNMNNTWIFSDCDNFTVNDNIPEISNAFIKDTDLSSTEYTTEGNSINVQADIENTNSDYIWLDMTSLAWASYDRLKCSDTDMCNYSNWTVVYTFSVWFSGSVNEWNRQVKFYAQNTDWWNEQTQIATIKIDKTSPNVYSNAIIQPNGWEIWWGVQDIEWDASKITDWVWIEYIKLEVLTGSNIWNLIYTWSKNDSPYSWDLSSLAGWTWYKVRLTAYDYVGLTGSDISDGTFSVDAEVPQISSGFIISPSSWNLLKWWNSFDILRNSGYISDDITSITWFSLDIYYSIDNWTNWSTISNGENNDGSYNWNIPNVDTSQGKIKIIVYDEAWNSTGYTTDYNFSIDSTVPTLDITYVTETGDTPPPSAKINNKWFDISASANDSNLSWVHYKLENTTDSDYRNAKTNSWEWSARRNLMCSSSCSNSFTWVNASIENAKDYSLTFQAKDLAGNKKEKNVWYVWDTQKPSITSFVSSWSYFSGSVNISWTGYDNYSIDSVNLEILKWNNYWNWTSFQSDQYSLAVSGTTNWDYLFEMPDSDSEWQKYQIIYKIFDDSYTQRNFNTRSINIYKDTQWPEIITWNFRNAPVGETKIGGWSSFTIDWNSGNISDDFAWLWNKPIEIYYQTGSWIWNLITWATENDGDFEWWVPDNLDTTSAQLKLIASDSIWNTNQIFSENFTIDSNSPSLTKLTTVGNGQWQINWLYLTFSENIDDSSVNTWDFSVSDWISLSWFTTAWTSDDNQIELQFASTGNTATTPTLSYTEWSLADLAGNKLSSFSDFSSEDKAVPRIQETKIFDEDLDGRLDNIEVVFSENLQTVSDISVFSLVNPLWGLIIDWVSRDSENHSIIKLNLTGQNNKNTSSGGMELNFDGNSNDYVDMSDNQAAQKDWNFLIDKAKPVFVSATTKDTNWDYINNEVVLNFSENVTGFDLNQFSVYNLSSWANVSWAVLNNDNIVFSIQNATLDTDVKPNIDYTGDFLEDFNNNKLNHYTWYNVKDGIPPKLLSRQTYDANWNGKIDAIKLIFSETLNGNFGWFVANVDWYVVSGYNSDSDLVYVDVNEKSVYDSDQTPAVQIDSNNTLADLSSNLVETESSSTPAQDKIWPVIIWARYDEWENLIYADFSENFSGDLISSDFVLTWSSMSISWVIATGWTSKAKIYLTWGDSINYWQDGISFAIGSVEDMYWNTQNATYFAKISASVVINEIMWSNKESWNYQYIELRNLASSNISLSWWSIMNGGGSWVNISLPSSENLWSGWYYLITSWINKFDVTPDLNTGKLDLSTGDYNIVLQDENGVDIDIVKTIFSPLIGDKDVPKSMERKKEAWDGLSSENWYTAEFSTWFITDTPKWTPGKENVFDGTAPTITNFSPLENQLRASGLFDIVFDYSDNTGGVGIDKNSDKIDLKKWNGSSYVDFTTTWVDLNNKTITLSKAIYPTKILPYGKYKAIFQISDNAGNTVQKEVIFYVDDLQININKNFVNMGELKDNDENLSWEVIVTIKTVWAGFDIYFGKDSLLSSNSDDIQDRTGAKGFGYDIYKDENWTIYDYSHSIVGKIKNTQIANITGSLNTDWDLNTYTYKIRYWANIDIIQSAGKYSSITDFKFKTNY